MPDQIQASTGAPRVSSAETTGTHPSRRKFIISTGAAAVLGGHAPGVLAQSKAPLKLGALNSYSKVFAALGNANLNGMNLYLEENGGSFAGRKVEIIKEDDEINPQVGLQKLKKLVEGDKCDLITGIQASNVAMAAVEYFRQSKAFYLCSGAGVTALSYVKVPYFFRCSLSARTLNTTMGDWYYDNVGKEAVFISSDFTPGYTTRDEFKSVFAPRGGKITKEIFAPLGNNDFSAYLADIRNIAPAGVYSFFAGTDAVRFVKQYAEYGIKAKSRLCGPGFIADSDTLPAQGKDALGIVNTLHYADTLDNPANVKFVAGYLAKYKEYPSVYAEYGYVAARLLNEALKAVDGNTQDKDKLRAALLAVRIDAPRGPFSFDPNTQGPIHNIYIREVAEVNGRITNKVIHTIPNVREPATMPT